MFCLERWFLFNVRRSLIEPKDWLSFKFIDYLCFLPPFGLDCLWIYSNKEKSTMILNAISTLEMSLIFIILSEIFIYYSTFIWFSGDFFVVVTGYVKFSLYANICKCVWCIFFVLNPTGSLRIVCSLSLFFHLSINLLLVGFVFFFSLPPFSMFKHSETSLLGK